MNLHIICYLAGYFLLSTFICRDAHITQQFCLISDQFSLHPPPHPQKPAKNNAGPRSGFNYGHSGPRPNAPGPNKNLKTWNAKKRKWDKNIIYWKEHNLLMRYIMNHCYCNLYKRTDKVTSLWIIMGPEWWTGSPWGPWQIKLHFSQGDNTL